MTRMVVGPFNRVEGDLEVGLDIVDGHVAAARVTAPLFRGFEQILVDRAPLDALVVAPRICGICSVAQSAAAAAALGAALGVSVPENGRRVADLLLAVENAADHLTHFALFFMPDFARADYRERPWYDDAEGRFAALRGSSAKAAAAARARLLHVVGLLAGKWPHTLALQPGGVAKSVDVGEAMRLLSVLADFRAYLEGELFQASLEEVAALDGAAALEAFAERHPQGDFALFLRIAADLGLDRLGLGPGRFLSYGGPLGQGGIWRDGNLLPLDLGGLREDLASSWMRGGTMHPAKGVTIPDADKAGAYSWSKAPRLDGQSVEVGALARQRIAGHPLIAGLLEQSGGAGSVRDRVVARLLELALWVPVMEALVRGLDPQGAFCAVAPVPDRSIGCGLVEAARGSLGHWLTVERGVIASYQIVAPTSWNFSPRDTAGNPGPLEQALAGTPVPAGQPVPLLVQHVVRSFDPCMSCTVH
ncbi:MAG TPA: nickel-dependent hydrogenase large subunit [Candidatus Sulfotelmatobacter sp.]|jgi:hydrogenase large subunit|nr:nickel-dependent hydrogenase large subunit [Candidatus Sulfotelmatobacter sp.]